MNAERIQDTVILDEDGGGYGACPNCEGPVDETNIIWASKPVYIETWYGDWYEWDEQYKCPSCGAVWTECAG